MQTFSLCYHMLHFFLRASVATGCLLPVILLCKWLTLSVDWLRLHCRFPEIGSLLRSFQRRPMDTERSRCSPFLWHFQICSLSIAENTSKEPQLPLSPFLSHNFFPSTKLQLQKQLLFFYRYKVFTNLGQRFRSFYHESERVDSKSSHVLGGSRACKYRVEKKYDFSVVVVIWF